MNALERAAELGAEIESVRESLAADRAALVEQRRALDHRIAEIDRALKRLSGRTVASPPADANDAAPRPSLSGVAIGREGVPLNARDILHVVANYYRLSPHVLIEPGRLASIALARHVAMYLARCFTRESFPQIGMTFGGRDHTTVIAAVDKIRKRLEEDPQLRGEVEEIERAICAARPGLELTILPPLEARSAAE